jgi:hypothetical protein
MKTATTAAASHLRTCTFGLAPALLLLGALVAGCGGTAPGVPSGLAGSVTGTSEDSPAGAGAGTTVLVYVNHAPNLTSLTGEQAFAVDTAGQVAMQVRLDVSATDEDGDDLRFTWLAPGCPDAVLTVTSEPGDAQGRWRSRVDLTAGASEACEVRVEVRDLWKGGQPPADSGLPVDRGGLATGAFQLAPAPRVGQP